MKARCDDLHRVRVGVAVFLTDFYLITIQQYFVVPRSIHCHKRAYDTVSDILNVVLVCLAGYKLGAVDEGHSLPSMRIDQYRPDQLVKRPGWPLDAYEEHTVFVPCI